MSLPPAPATDPTWYRLRYSLAAQRLHVASVGAGEIDLELLEELTGGVGMSADLSELETSFPAAEMEARWLLASAAAILLRSGRRWVGCPPSRLGRAWARVRHRWARLRRRAHPLASARLAAFLEEVVEPAALVLFWSAGVGRESEDLTIDLRARAAAPLDRRQWIGDESDRWRRDYLDYLLAPMLLPRSRPRRLLAALGLSRFSQPRRPGYRVDYNLACLLSRLLAFDRQRIAGQEREAIVNAAATHLRRSLDALGSERRRRVARWAWRDPGLAALRRESDGAPFRRIAGPRPSDPLG